MPDDRFIHPRLGQSDKVGDLDDFQYRVWTTYIFASDDCGIMRASAAPLKNASNRLDVLPDTQVEAALETIIAIGLLRTFVHQKRRYVFQHDWQEWQKVRWPRQSVNPDLPSEALAACTTATQDLMRLRASKSRNSQEKIETEEIRRPSEVLRSISDPIANCTPALANGLRQEAKGNGSDAPVEFRRMPTGRSDGVFEGALQRNHLKHTLCSPSFSHCMTPQVHEKMLIALAPRFGSDKMKASAALKQWYPEVWATLADDFVMGDAFKFWQAHFDVKWASDVRAGPKVLTEAEVVAEYKRQEDFRAELRARSRATNGRQ